MICALIVAGGSGMRMNVPIKKQYLALNDLPILAHTLMAFDQHVDVDRILLVVPEQDVAYCREKIIVPLGLSHDVQLVEGGIRRQESVSNGLDALECYDGIVMIHDGVRPFVRPSLIDACIAGVGKTGACIPVVPVTDTIKQIDEKKFVIGTLQRERIRLAQTPQTFSVALIRKAYALARKSKFTATDDASIAEFAGENVFVVSGDQENIKITHPADLEIARGILGRRSDCQSR